MLQGVSETALWTLYQRAAEARRADAVINDVLAVDLVERIEFPFEERFGEESPLWSQWQALRARAFDREVGRFLDANPRGTVIALGEGLETQFWRVDNGTVRWVTVDLPEVIAARRELLPAGKRQQMIARSVTEHEWLDEADTGNEPVLITAQGLLMYLAPNDVHALIGACAARFRPGFMVFDAVSQWLSERSKRGEIKTGTEFHPPPWIWGINDVERRAILSNVHVARLQELRLPRGRGGVFGYAVPALGRMPGTRRAGFTMLAAGFR